MEHHSPLLENKHQWMPVIVVLMMRQPLLILIQNHRLPKNQEVRHMEPTELHQNKLDLHQNKLQQMILAQILMSQLHQQLKPLGHQRHQKHQRPQKYQRPNLHKMLMQTLDLTLIMIQ